MNKICVVAKNKETFFIKRLIEEVGQGPCFFNPWTDLEVPPAEIYLVRTTGVYRSDLDLLILQTLPEQKLINNLKTLKLFRSKNVQYEWFEQENIRALPWLPLKGMDPLTVEKFFRLYPEVVVKPLIGQGGWGVEGLNWSQFQSWWKKRRGKDEDYLIQPFLKDAMEYRYFFMKGHSGIVLERKTKGGIAANFQKQGEAKLSALPSILKDMVENLAEKSGAFYGAIDLIIKDESPYILELNSVPGIEQLEQVTGENVMRGLLRSLGL